jgi:hypothetical protein
MQLMAKALDDDEVFNKFLLEVAQVEEPGRGRRKRR